MNILLVSDVYLPTVSGVAASTDAIAKYLASTGHKVFLVCPQPPTPLKETTPNVTIIYTPSFPDPFFIGKRMNIFPFGFKEILTTLNTYTIDIAHIQEPASLGVVALICCKLKNIPTVGAMHFSFEQIRLLIHPLMRPLVMLGITIYLKLLYPLYDAIMVPTQTVVAFARRLLKTKQSIRAVSNGVDTTFFAPSKQKNSLRKKLNISANTVLFLHIGRLDNDKNIQSMIAALQGTSPNIHFALAGIGKEEPHLRALAQRLAVEGKITWLGKIDRPTMAMWYNVADCFVISSPVETQSIVTLQAVASGIPTIAARAGALPELVHDGENGYLVDPYDVAAYTRSMNTLARQPKLRAAMGVKSRQISLPHHQPNALAELVALYNEVLMQKRAVLTHAPATT
jgi:glycosyltransferase involved in cell wall biosynthesis